MCNRGTYSPRFKAKVVLEAIRDQKNAARICREYDIDEDLLERWKRAFLQNSPLLFATEKVEFRRMQRRVEKLEQLVGELTHELEISKRALDFIMRVLSARREADSTVCGPKGGRDLRTGDEVGEVAVQFPQYG